MSRQNRRHTITAEDRDSQRQRRQRSLARKATDKQRSRARNLTVNPARYSNQ